MNFKDKISSPRFFLLSSFTISVILLMLSLAKTNFNYKEFLGQNIEDLFALLMMFGLGLFVIGLVYLVFSYFKKTNHDVNEQDLSFKKKSLFFSDTGLVMITIVIFAVSFFVGLIDSLGNFN